MENEVQLTWEMAELPEWLHLLPLGRVELVDGRPPFEVDAASLAEMAEAFAARGTDLVIDYEHQSLKGVQAPAAGWIKELKAREDGLWARVEWTPQAREYLKRREYRYFSPVLRLDSESRRPLELLNVALTNVPAIRNLSPLVAKWGGQSQVGGTRMPKPDLIEGKADFSSAVPEESTSAKTTSLVAELKMRLGIKADSPESRVWGRTVEFLRSLAQALELPPEATIQDLQGGLAALKAEVGKLQAVQEEALELREKLREAEVKRVVEEALRAGKITPAQRSWALSYCRRDLEGFREFVAQAPQVVPLGIRLNLKEESRRKEQVLTPEELALCQALNLSPEAYSEAKATLGRAH